MVVLVNNHLLLGLQHTTLAVAVAVVNNVAVTMVAQADAVAVDMAAQEVDRQIQVVAVVVEEQLVILVLVVVPVEEEHCTDFQDNMFMAKDTEEVDQDMITEELVLEEEAELPEKAQAAGIGIEQRRHRREGQPEARLQHGPGIHGDHHHAIPEMQRLRFPNRSRGANAPQAISLPWGTSASVPSPVSPGPP